jgi:hypothetical protein
VESGLAILMMMRILVWVCLGRVVMGGGFVWEGEGGLGVLRSYDSCVETNSGGFSSKFPIILP